MWTVALIINTYNQLDYLARVLTAVSGQSARPDEVLLADDGSGEETARLFANWLSGGRIKGAHVWQQHQGFRRARILNKAIACSGTDYIVFLDGDTVPHPEFVADHRRVSREGLFIQGHRALLKQKGAASFGRNGFARDRRRALLNCQIQGLKHAFRWPRPSLRMRPDLRGIRGCNLGIWRRDLLRVNGYNEAFVGWGREDSELALRLMNAGVKRLDVRGWALCYHLWHAPASREGLQANDDLLGRAQAEGLTRCEMGIDQHVGRKS